MAFNLNDTGLNDSDASSAISALLSGKPVQNPKESTKASSKVGATPEPTETDDGAGLEDALEIDTSENDDTNSKSRRKKVKFGDREIELEVVDAPEDFDLESLPSGLLMEADYRRKTQEVSQKAKDLEARESEFNSKVDEITQSLMGEAEWLDSAEGLQLRKDDPEEYYMIRAKLEDKAEKIQKYRQEQERKFKEAHQALVTQERSKWKEISPDWLDESRMKEDFNLMTKTMRDVGFSDDEIGNIYDSRLVNILHKAAKYDQLQNKPMPEKVKSQPKVNTSGAKQSFEGDDLTSKMEKLKKTGKDTDAADLLASMFSKKRK